MKNDVLFNCHYVFLSELLAGAQIFYNYSLAQFTTFGIGGRADVVIFVNSLAQLTRGISFCREAKIRYIVLGKGSNCLIDSGEVHAVVFVTTKLDSVKVIGQKVIAQCGASAIKVFSKCFEGRLVGGEFLSSIPASIGGATAINAGCFGQEMSQIVSSVKVFDGKKEFCISRQECEFNYRESIIARSHLVALETEMSLCLGTASEILQVARSICQQKRATQPLREHSAGSVFKRGSDFVPAKLIDDLGLKGLKIGGAQVSVKHAGFIVNDGTATSEDVLNLISEIRKRVYLAYGKRLETEIVYIRG